MHMQDYSPNIEPSYDRYAVLKWGTTSLSAIAEANGADHIKRAAQIIPENFRYLVNLTTGGVVAPVLAFLASRVLNRGASALNTTDAQAYDLRSWFEFLAMEGVTWDEADQRQVDDYIEDMAAAAHDEDGDLSLSASTIARRASTIVAFYRYLKERNGPNIVLSARNARGAGRVVTSSVRPISTEDLATLVRLVGPPPSKRRAGETSRLYLAVMLALACGLRRFEVCILTIDQFKDLTPDPDVPNGLHAVTIIGKGRRERSVLVPGWLARELQIYMEGERAEIVSDHPVDHGTLLVNGARAGEAAGRPLKPGVLSREFRKVVLAAGLMRPRPGYRHGSGLSTVAHTFHDLRHTCACLHFVAYRTVEADPWLRVQRVLGHAFAQTTIRTYLAFIDEFEPGPGELVQRLLRLVTNS